MAGQSLVEVDSRAADPAEGKEPALDREAAGEDSHPAEDRREVVRPAVLAAAGSA